MKCTKEVEYDCAKYEWKFRINDQPWGWNCDLDRGYNTDAITGQRKSAKKATVTFADNTIKHYDSVSDIANEYKIPVQSIYVTIKKRGEYISKQHGILIRYVEKAKTQAGVNYNKRHERWQAFIYTEGKKIYLGSFSEKEDAIKARLSAEELVRSGNWSAK